MQMAAFDVNTSTYVILLRNANDDDKVHDVTLRNVMTSTTIISSDNYTSVTKVSSYIA